MKKFFLTMTVVVYLASSTAAAQMQCPQCGMMQSRGAGHGMTGGRGGAEGAAVPDPDRILTLRQQLKLSDEQVNKIRGIASSSTRESVKRQAELQLARLDATEALQQGKPDFASARTAMKRISELQLQSSIARLDAFQKAYNVLNNDQKNMLNQMLSAGMRPSAGANPDMTEETE